jgi:NTP pyrophosphatase (non-canonical NTP hydrolase)
MQAEATADSKRWFPATSKNVFFIAAAMMAEAGEAVNIAKKIERGDVSWLDDVRENFAEEVADVFTYMLTLCDLIGVNLIEEYYKKRMRNERRFTNRAIEPAAQQHDEETIKPHMGDVK